MCSYWCQHCGYYLHQQGGGYVIVWNMSICEQDYWKSNEPISLKLGVMIGPTNRKNWFTFGGAPVPGTDYGPLFNFSHHCGIGNFMRFISISRSHHLIFTKLGEMTDTDKIMNSRHFGSYPAVQTSRSGLIWQSGLESWITFRWNFGIGGGLCSLSTVLFIPWAG